MTVDPEQLRALANTLTGDIADIVRYAAMEIEWLNRYLHGTHVDYADSERLDWLSAQVYDAQYDSTHRAYFTLPRIVARKDGVVATTLREAIDLVRRPANRDF
ncbi:hypothetical protein POK33_07580 [Burkholderia cenocepacia]|uniref:hypothetical protein n=1 Tax=Burkholderia cenocepacia TaxID=95486 RepID=UPI0023B927AC|nr:hypothetical protein [Burkholderia cenocepacia]MDF0500588.1 hypothetical protein [Burkholderia cenocepacia]